MVLPSGPARPSFTYGQTPGNSGRPAIIPHSTASSSTNTQNTNPLNGIIFTNTSSTQGSQAQLLQPGLRQTHRRKLRLKDKFRRRCSRFQSTNSISSTPRTSTTRICVAIFAVFLAFLSLAAHFAVKPIWIAVMMVGGSVSFGLLLVCFLEHRRGDSLP
jgi:uncharacterized membrane protein (DUF485 family)